MIVMDDAFQHPSRPDEITQLRALLAACEQQLTHRDQIIRTREQQLTQHEATIAQHQSTIAALIQQRDEFYLKALQLEVRLAKALKQVYGPRADRVSDPAQLVLDFARQWEALPIRPEDLSAATAEAAEADRLVPRRLRTRGRRDLGALDHLPLIEKTYEPEGDLCRCPACQNLREKIGAEITYTIEHIPASFLRIKHIQYKYACRVCEQNGDNPRIELAGKTHASPIDKGLPGPGLLAYIATAKYADFCPLHRLQNIFARNGFELDRSTMCLWMADVARLLRPIYDRMAQRVRLSHVLATDDTVMPLLQPGRTKQAGCGSTSAMNLSRTTSSTSLRLGRGTARRGSSRSLAESCWRTRTVDMTASFWIATCRGLGAGPMRGVSSSKRSRPRRTWPERSCA